MKPIPPIPNSKEEKLQLLPIRNQGEFFVEPKEIKQGVTVEEVLTTNEIPEEVDKSQEERKGVGINKLEVLPFMEDNHHHGTIIFQDLTILSCRRIMLTVLNSSSSYHLLSARGRNVFPKVCQISSPIVLCS